MGVDAVLEAWRRFGWSEDGWWAWEDLNLRLHPQVRSPAAVANYLVLTKADADLASSAEQSTA
jgi:hypothetical protein